MRRLALSLAVAALALPAGAVGDAHFVPDDPLAAKQWYLAQIHAFDFWPDGPPTLPPVRVAVIDSGSTPTIPSSPGASRSSRASSGATSPTARVTGRSSPGSSAPPSGTARGSRGSRFPPSS